ncbi:MAG: type II secretion system F family protein [Candidatus Aenigmarchaeota archaeon]|nr:type II secretion system F family protein [Candidatus Aenigmarchaeota archaeon]
MKPLTKLLKITAATTIIGAAMIAINFLYFQQEQQLFTAINGIAGFILVAVPFLFRHKKYSEIKKFESLFPKYLHDVSSNLSAGMTLSQAVKSTDSNEYGQLTRYVREISAKLSWGIPFEKALMDFAEKIGSVPMRRNIRTIVESYRSGGKISVILESVSQSLTELEKIKKERAASVYSQTLNGYMIYIIFLGIMAGLSNVLVPVFQTDVSGNSGGLTDLLKSLFRDLTIVQGLFAGIAIGKMSEGTIIAGIKHSIVFVVLAYSIFLVLG